MMKPTQNREGDNLATCAICWHWPSFRRWDLLLDPLMWPGSIEVLNVGVEHAVELLLMEDEQVIETLASHTSEKPFTDGIGSSCSVFRHHHPSFLHLVTKQPTYIPEHDLSARNQIVEAQQEEDERLRRRDQQAPPPRAARFLLEGSKRRPRHERFVA